jgi:hypothetical protein
VRLSDIQQKFSDNPLGWVLFALLLLSIYYHYRDGKDLEKVCELTGPHDVSVPNPLTTQQEITNICLQH